MAEGSIYPQIPTRVWWGVRGIFQRNPRTRLDETTMAIQIEVQQSAARQYLAELRKLDLINEDGNVTELGMKWRMDETYPDAARAILEKAYPTTLVDLAPPHAADRAKVESWFMHQGLGQGTARNKAATYLLIANGDPVATNAVPARAGGNGATKPQQKAQRTPRQAAKGAVAESGAGERKEAPIVVPNPATARVADGFPLNVNLQIHISAEASVEQIEAIFSAMRKYLHGDATS